MFDWFKKKEKLKYPMNFAIVRFTELAKEKGIFDDFNKEIVIYSNGEIDRIIPYSKHDVKALREIHRIPVQEEQLKEEEFKFDEVATFGAVIQKR